MKVTPSHPEIPVVRGKNHGDNQNPYSFSNDSSSSIRIRSKVRCLVLVLILVSNTMLAQSYYSEGNALAINITTATRGYAFETTCMSARLNNEKGRFEFEIPLATIKSKGDASDLAFLKRIMQGGNSIVLEASIPYCDDAVSDISYLTAFPSIQIIAEVHLGKFHMINDLLLCDIKVVEDHYLRFDFDCFINTRSIPMDKLVGEKIREIRLEAEAVTLIAVSSF